MLDIEKRSYTTSQNQKLYFGIHTSFRGERLHINLFDLEENKDGPKIFENLFTLTSQIAPTLFNGYASRAEAEWSMTTGYRTSKVFFDDLYGRPMGLSVSDRTALEWEQFNPFPLERYRQEYVLDAKDRPIHQSDLNPGDEPVYPKQPKKVFAIPCEKAKDGVFYMKPEMWSTDLEQNYTFFLANTTDLIERIKRDDPQMIEHMNYKFKGTNIDRLLEHNGIENPDNAGGFAFGEWIKDDVTINPGPKLTMSTGDAGSVKLAYLLNLPFYPVQVDNDGMDEDPIVRASWIEMTRRDIGYRPVV